MSRDYQSTNVKKIRKVKKKKTMSMIMVMNMMVMNTMIMMMIRLDDNVIQLRTCCSLIADKQNHPRLSRAQPCSALFATMIEYKIQSTLFDI